MFQWILEAATVVFDRKKGKEKEFRGSRIGSPKAEGVRLERVEPIEIENVEVIVELPRGFIANRVRKLKITSPATAGEISKELAERLNVNQDKWKLFGSLNKESIPKKLDVATPVDRFRSDRNPNARLYFYPEITVK
jgi:hypothetical protein